MSFWTALDAGVNSFQRSTNWVGNTVAQINQLREQDEQTRENRVMSRAYQDVSAPAPVDQAAPTGPMQTQTAAPEPQAPTQAPVSPGGGSGAAAAPGGAPATALRTPVSPGGTPGVAPPGAPPSAAPGMAAQAEDPVHAQMQQALSDYKDSIHSGPPSATGEPTVNREVVRDTITGQGMWSPNSLMATTRRVSGNASGPLGTGDIAALMTAGEQRLVAQGLGHRVPAWRARVLQQFQSAASRTAAIAAAQAEGGDLSTAARTMATAYGFVPDGMTVNVQDTPNGPVAIRTGADGQQYGGPISMTPQTLREMAIQVADPGAMETLINQRRVLDETHRHNVAAEGISAARAAGRGGRGGGGGAGGRETSLTTHELSQANEAFDGLMDAYAPATANRPRGSPDALSTEQVRGIGRSLIQQGTDPGEAYRIASGIGLRTATAQRGDQGGVRVVLDGRGVELSGATAALVQHYSQPRAPDGQALGQLPGRPAAPTHSGTRALRQQPQ